MNGTLLEEIVEIDRARKRLKGELDALNDARAIIEEQLLTEWEMESVTSTKVSGVTIYLHSQKWATPKNGNRQAVVGVLELLGMEEFVTFNTQTLSSYVRGLEKEGEELPPELAEVIEVREDFKIKTRGT